MKYHSTFLLLTATLAVALPSIAPATEAVTPDLVVTEIVTRNPELAFYEAEIAAARAGVRSAGAPADPELSLGLGRKRVTDSVGVLAGEGTAWSVSVSQTFEWPGASRCARPSPTTTSRWPSSASPASRPPWPAAPAPSRTDCTPPAERAAAAAEVAARYQALRELFLARDPGGITPLLETRVIEAQELTLQKRATEAQLAVPGRPHGAEPAPRRPGGQPRSRVAPARNLRPAPLRRWRPRSPPPAKTISSSAPRGSSSSSRGSSCRSRARRPARRHRQPLSRAGNGR
jgi:hypothetical protein